MVLQKALLPEELSTAEADRSSIISKMTLAWSCLFFADETVQEVVVVIRIYWTLHLGHL